MGIGSFKNLFYLRFAFNLFLLHHCLKPHCHLPPLKETQQIKPSLLALTKVEHLKITRLNFNTVNSNLSFKYHITAG